MILNTSLLERNALTQTSCRNFTLRRALLSPDYRSLVKSHSTRPIQTRNSASNFTLKANHLNLEFDSNRCVNAVRQKKTSTLRPHTVNLENVFITPPGERGKDRERFHARRPATEMISREWQCPNNGLENRSRPIFEGGRCLTFRKCFFSSLPPLRVCRSSLFLVRVRKKKEAVFPWKLPPGYYGLPSRRLPPRRSSLTYSLPPTSSLRSISYPVFFSSVLSA